MPALLFSARGRSIIHAFCLPAAIILWRYFTSDRETVIDSFHTAYDQHAFVFLLVLLAAVLAVGIWTWRVKRYAQSVEARLNSIFRESGNESTARVLADYLNTVRATAQSVARMQEQHESIVRIMPTVIRH